MCAFWQHDPPLGVDIGVGPTPYLYFAVHHLNADGGVQITASAGAWGRSATLPSNSSTPCGR